MKSIFSYLLIAALSVGISSYAADEKPEKKKKKKPKAGEVAADGKKEKAPKKAKGQKGKKAGGANLTEVGTLSSRKNPEGKQVFIIKTANGTAQLNADLSARLQTAIDRIERGDAAKVKPTPVKEKKAKKPKDPAAKKTKKTKEPKNKIPAAEIPDF